jgi:hypothetical protein
MIFVPLASFKPLCYVPANLKSFFMETIAPKERRQKQKVYYKHHDYQGGYYHPHIRIAGKFLEKFNFHVGDFIDVCITEGKITITKILETAPPEAG